MAVEAQNPCENCGARNYSTDDEEYVLLKKGEDIGLAVAGPMLKLLTCQQCGAIRLLVTQIAEAVID